MQFRLSLVALSAALSLLSGLVVPAHAQVTIETKEAKLVKVPTSLLKTEDDHLCTLRWNGFPSNSDSAATKFEVRWGLVSEGYTRSASTPYTGYQIQPIQNGEAYLASVRAVDRWGRASAWSPSINFTGNSARVDAIRAQCSVPGGFFDDFNVPAGKPDWTHWNFAVSRYTDETKNGFFINDQMHAHIMTASLRNDRSQVVARVRGNMLDLSDNGTRTVFIDMDSHFDIRNTWYLDFIPETDPLWDITNRASVDLSDSQSYDPPGLLRFTVSGPRFSVQVADSRGVTGPAAVVDLFWLKDVEIKGMLNIRRPWKFTISKSLVEAYVMTWEGTYIKVLSTPVRLAWDRARVHNTVFGYNTPKNGYAAWLWHFDNFGFDAPAGAAPAQTVYDYRTKLTNGSEYAVNNYVIKVPDAVLGWSHRLFYTLSKNDGNQSSFVPGSANKVTVNGQSFPITLADDLTRSRMIELPPGVVVQGDNSVVFNLIQSGAMNVHIEAVRPPFDWNPLPDFSTHCEIWGCPPMPTLDLGSDATFEKINDYQMWQWNFHDPITVHGTVTLDTLITQSSCITGTGKPAEVDHMDFMVDGVSKLSVSLSAASTSAGGRYRFTLNTKRLSNGVHELFLRAYTPSGTISNPDYFERGSSNSGPGSYIPVLIRVAN